MLLCLQARGFVKARSGGSLDAYTIAVSQAIVDEDDEDVVQVGAATRYPEVQGGRVDRRLGLQGECHSKLVEKVAYPSEVGLWRQGLVAHSMVGA